MQDNHNIHQSPFHYVNSSIFLPLLYPNGFNPALSGLVLQNVPDFAFRAFSVAYSLRAFSSWPFLVSAIDISRIVQIFLAFSSLGKW